MPLAQAVTAEPPSPARTVAGKSEPLDLSKETFSIAEAARFLKITEGHTRYLGELGVLPMHEVGGELRIRNDDLVVYYRKEETEMERLRNSPFLQELDSISDALLETGLYWKSTPEALAQHTR